MSCFLLFPKACSLGSSIYKLFIFLFLKITYKINVLFILIFFIICPEYILMYCSSLHLILSILYLSTEKFQKNSISHDISDLTLIQNKSIKVENILSTKDQNSVDFSNLLFTILILDIALNKYKLKKIICFIQSSLRKEI